MTRAGFAAWAIPYLSQKCGGFGTGLFFFFSFNVFVEMYVYKQWKKRLMVDFKWHIKKKHLVLVQLRHLVCAHLCITLPQLTVISRASKTARFSLETGMMAEQWCILLSPPTKIATKSWHSVHLPRMVLQHMNCFKRALYRLAGSCLMLQPHHPWRMAHVTVAKPYSE